jgi:hypothetical protein
VSVYRQIHTRIWQDAWFLDLLPEEKLLFVYTFSNEHSTLCGLYELPLKTMAFETGLRTDAITLTLHRFGEAGKVLYAPPYIWVPNLRKYNENGSPKVAAMIQAQLADIPDCELKRRYLDGDLSPLDVAPVSTPEPDAVHGYTVSEKFPNRASNSNSTSEQPTDKERRSRIPAEYPSSQAFRDIVHRWPVKSLQADMHAVVGSDPEDVELWRKVVRAWIGLGWNPMNTDGMLEFFKRKEIPQIGRPGDNGKPAKMTDKEYGERLRAGTLPVEPEPFIPPSMRA